MRRRSGRTPRASVAAMEDQLWKVLDLEFLGNKKTDAREGASVVG